MKPVLILTEATSSTGLGHFTRCTALAEILSEDGATVTLCTIQDKMPLPQISTGIVHLTHDWQNMPLPESIMARAAETTLFIDSYLAEGQIYDNLATIFPNMYCIDDFNRMIYPPQSKVINPGIGGMFVDYSNQAAQCLFGIDYVLLRKPFRANLKISPIAPTIRKILITLGAEDRWNIIPEIVKTLEEQNLDRELHLILGPGFKNRQEILGLSAQSVRIHESLSAEDIRDLMLTMDLAVTGGGQTTNELARCGIPMIVLKIADNQSGNIHGLMHLKLIRDFCRVPDDAVAFVNSEMIRLTNSLERSKARLPALEDFGSGLGYSELFP